MYDHDSQVDRAARGLAHRGARGAGAVLLAALCIAGRVAASAATPRPAEPRGDFDLSVVLDPTQQRGEAHAMVRIHARRDVVWRMVTTCSEEMRLVPGLVDCEVLETAGDGSWQRVRHVLDYSWYMPSLTYEIRANYDRPARVTVERVSGDLRRLSASWSLESDGADTLAHYSVELDPGFWVPHWLVRVALRRDLPKMLRALRSRAEVLQRTDHE